MAEQAHGLKLIDELPLEGKRTLMRWTSMYPSKTAASRMTAGPSRSAWYPPRARTQCSLPLDESCLGRQKASRPGLSVSDKACLAGLLGQRSCIRPPGGRIRNAPCERVARRPNSVARKYSFPWRDQERRDAVANSPNVKCYVNDAFGTTHRACEHAGCRTLVENRAAGYVS